MRLYNIFCKYFNMYFDSKYLSCRAYQCFLTPSAPLETTKWLLANCSLNLIQGNPRTSPCPFLLLPPFSLNPPLWWKQLICALLVVSNFWQSRSGNFRNCLGWPTATQDRSHCSSTLQTRVGSSINKTKSLLDEIS